MEAERHVLSDNDDIISSMPDPILIHVLSFLRAREAVRTGQLSKRWIDLWAYSPSLNFDAEEFGSDDVTFERFVNALLLHRKNSPLDTFQLKWDNEERNTDTNKPVTSWILHSVKCKPRVLSVCCPTYDHMNFPYSIFCCTSLEEVKLFIRDDMISKAITPRSVNLPLLRKLSLGFIKVRPEFMEKLLLGCPLLEELKMDSCFLYDMEICSPLLKHLTIVDCDSVDVFISCPGLLNLDIKIYSCEIRFGNLSSLENASIHFPRRGMNCCEILSSLINATEIKLFGEQFKTILEKELPNCSTFKNLKHLVLDARLESGNFGILASFLRCSPNFNKFCLEDIEDEELLIEKAIAAPQHDGDANNDNGDNNHADDDEDQDDEDEYVDIVNP